MRIGPAERFAYTFDPGSFTELPPPSVPADPLRFKGDKKYADEIKAARAKTGRPEAFTAARGTIDGLPVMIGVQPFDFLGGSLGLGRGRGAGGIHAGRDQGKAALHPVRRRPAARACRKASCP